MDKLTGELLSLGRDLADDFDMDRHAQAMFDAAARIQALEAELAGVREALGWFLADERFQVAVGGNPNVVERMLDDARAILHRGEVDPSPETTPDAEMETS